MRPAALCLALLLLAGCAAAPGPPAVSEPWPGPDSVNVPVLMYHHITDTGGTDATISPEHFRRQLDAVKAAGYTPVSLDELIGFADGEGALPEKPVCITFDDGYMSTYDTAFPILGEYGYPAAVFVIGSSVGRDTYKDTGRSIIPHFGTDQMAEMTASGRMEVQSHTFDMHQTAAYETGPARTSILPLEGESEEAYAAALEEDFRLEAEALAQGGVDRITALAYPLGRHSDLADSVLRELGVRLTLTTDSGHVNTVTRNDPDSLWGLGRLNMTNDTTDEMLLEYFQR